MEVISSNNDSSLHLIGNDNSFQDLTSDGDIRGKWAFLIDVSGFNSLFGSPDT